MNDAWDLGVTGILWRKNNRRRRGVLQLRQVFRVGQKGKVTCAGRSQGCHLNDLDGAIPQQLAAKKGNDTVEPQSFSL